LCPRVYVRISVKMIKIETKKEEVTKSVDCVDFGYGKYIIAKGEGGFLLLIKIFDNKSEKFTWLSFVSCSNGYTFKLYDTEKEAILDIVSKNTVNYTKFEVYEVSRKEFLALFK